MRDDRTSGVRLARLTADPAHGHRRHLARRKGPLIRKETVLVTGCRGGDVPGLILRQGGPCTCIR